MILTLKTDQPKVELGIFDGTASKAQLSWDAGRELSATLFTKLDEILGKAKVERSELTGIVVFRGPGSFTGLRIGVTVANTLGQALEIPVVGEGGQGWQSQGIKRILSGENDQIVVPEYGGEANITKPRK